MSTKRETTLRLNLPQWQDGNRHDYYIGSQLLAWLAPVANGPVETIPVPEPTPGETLAVENGIVARAALLRQARAAREAIEKHRPDRIVTLGGDCLIDLAPMAYLNTRYEGNLGVLWVEAHHRRSTRTIGRILLQHQRIHDMAWEPKAAFTALAHYYRG